MRYINAIALVLIVVGAINWGLYGVFHFNLVSWLLPHEMAARVVYGIIGLAGIWGLGFFARLGALCCCDKNSCRK